MAHLLFVTWSGAGNQSPAIGLATSLATRGHTVTFAGYPQQRETFDTHGLGFRVLPRAQQAWPSEQPEDWMPVLVDAVWACPAHLEDLPELVETEGCDAVVVDCLMTGAIAAAEALTVPVSVLVHSAPGALAPPGGGLDLLALNAANDIRERVGLPPVGTLWDTWRPFTTLCTSIPELDPLRDRLPDGFDFVGPLRAAAPTSGWTWPWAVDDDRPLVVASFSTGQAWDQTTRARRTAEALDGGGYRLLVLTGPAAAVRDAESPDVAVRTFVPHDEVFPRASVTVSHAGHGTVAASLAHGVPMVNLPNLAADQPALAAQVERLGAGLALDGAAATPEEIASAVRTVLTDPGYAATAGDVASALESAPGADGAADRIESLLAGR